MDSFELVNKTYTYTTANGKQKTVKRTYQRKTKENSTVNKEELEQKRKETLENLKNYCQEIENTKGKTASRILKDFNKTQSLQIPMRDAYEIIKSYNKAAIEKRKDTRFETFKDIRTEFEKILRNNTIVTKEEIVDKIAKGLGYTNATVLNVINITLSNRTIDQYKNEIILFNNS